MNRSRALPFVLPLALLLPGVLAADVVPASRQFEIAAPYTPLPPDARYRHVSATAVAVGSLGFVVGWDDDFYDPSDFESPSGASAGCWVSPEGYLAPGLFDNLDFTEEGSDRIALAQSWEREVVAVWENYYFQGAAIGYKIVELDPGLSQREALWLGDLPDSVYDVSPAVAANARDRFVIAWVRQDPTALRIMARVFTSGGIPVSPELEVSGTLSGSIWNIPDLSRMVSAGMDGDGNFVIVWLDTFEPNALHTLWGRRFDHDGQPLGERFRMGATYGDAVMAMRRSGDFVVSWQAPVQRGVRLLARFAADGQRLGHPVRVPGASDPAIAMDNLGYVALFWLEARRPALLVFGPTLQRVSPVLHDPPASRDPYRGRPGVAIAGDGRILTVWTGPRSPKAKDSVLGRIWQVR